MTEDEAEKKAEEAVEMELIEKSQIADYIKHLLKTNNTSE